MPIPIYTRGCIQLNKTCTGACTGYATTCTCPPLIVLAVIVTSPPPPDDVFQPKGISNASPRLLHPAGTQTVLQPFRT